MMALLYETVPAFEDTWMECLGDLGRYRMAIEDDDIRDREVWTGVSRHWYSKALNKAPTAGRLYHHLAVLARPNALQQLFYYAKSLCVVTPFTQARESILTIFEPILNSDSARGPRKRPRLNRVFVKAHGLLFTDRDVDKFYLTVKEFLGLLDNQIGSVTRKFMELGYYIAAANTVAMLGFASKENPIIQALAEDTTKQPEVEISGEDRLAAWNSFERAKHLSNETLEIVLRRTGDPNVLPFIHVTLVFMHHLARRPHAMKLLEVSFPWQSLTIMLNTLTRQYQPSADVPHETLTRAEARLSEILVIDSRQSMSEALFCERDWEEITSQSTHWDEVKDLLRSVNWIDEIDENRKKVLASDWMNLAKKKMETIGRSLLIRVRDLLEKELGIDVLAYVDLPTFSCTDHDMMGIVMSQGLGKEQQQWDETIYKNARYCLDHARRQLRIARMVWQQIESTDFPLPYCDDVRPFPEDFAMRGFLWADGYYPVKWFANDKTDDEERYLEVVSMIEDRKVRILWLGRGIARLGNWLSYDSKLNWFSVAPGDN